MTRTIAHSAVPTLGQVWDYSIELGIEMGHRDAKAVWQVCERNKARYSRMSAEKKRLFDKTRLSLPFGDCTLYSGTRGTRIRGLLAMIDAVPDAAMHIHELNSSGDWDIDLLFAHHGGLRKMMFAGEDYCVPDARCLAEHYGLPRKLLTVIESEARKLARKPGCGGPNPEGWVPLYMRVSGAAEMCRQIDVAHINIHTPCDVFIWRAVWDVLHEARPKTCQDAIEALYRIPEYRRFRQQEHQPIQMFSGKPGNRLGRWWNGNCASTLTLTERSIRSLKEAGFDSMVGVIYQGPMVEAAKKYGLNVIHLPHLPSDTLGINGLLDRLVERWPALEVLAYGKFIRVERPRCGDWTTAAI